MPSQTCVDEGRYKVMFDIKDDISLFLMEEWRVFLSPLICKVGERNVISNELDPIKSSLDFEIVDQMLWTVFPLCRQRSRQINRK